jgi:hypothetical protein
VQEDQHPDQVRAPTRCIIIRPACWAFSFDTIHSVPWA